MSGKKQSKSSNNGNNNGKSSADSGSKGDGKEVSGGAEVKDDAPEVLPAKADLHRKIDTAIAKLTKDRKNYQNDLDRMPSIEEKIKVIDEELKYLKGALEI